MRSHQSDWNSDPCNLSGGISDTFLLVYLQAEESVNIVFMDAGRKVAAFMSKQRKRIANVCFTTEISE